VSLEFQGLGFLGGAGLASLLLSVFTHKFL
jgi:hypothetical protein